MSVQPGELMRRYAWQALDSLGGKKQQKLKKVNKREIVRGVTPEYQARRIAAILRYASANCPFVREPVN